MSETERSERLGARRKKWAQYKENGPPGKSADKGEYFKEPRYKENGPPGKSADKGVYFKEPRDSLFVEKSDKGTNLYPVRELKALQLSSSDSPGSSEDESLDSEEEAELDEEVAEYEEESYHHLQGNKRHQRHSYYGIAASQVVPSAPPLYEVRRGSLSLLPDKVRRKLRSAFPVFEGLEDGRVYAPVEYNQIKELAESVRKYGVCANFTLAQLDRLARDSMTPADWQTVAKATLSSMGQYMEWKALWHEAAQEQARANAASLTPEQQEWTFDMLTGQGRYVTNQTNFPWGASTYLVVSLQDRPKLHLQVNGKSFEGILDTGVDKSIISSHWWPRSWPITKASHSLLICLRIFFSSFFSSFCRIGLLSLSRRFAN